MKHIIVALLAVISSSAHAARFNSASSSCVIIGSSGTSGEILLRGTMADIYDLAPAGNLCIAVQSGHNSTDLLIDAIAPTRIQVPQALSSCHNYSAAGGEFVIRGVLSPGADGGAASYTFNCTMD